MKMQKKYIKSPDKHSITKLFLEISSTLLVIFILVFMFNREIYTAIIHGDIYDAFMDYFNSVTHAMGRDPYGAEAIYPPLCYVIYWIMGMLMGDKAMYLFDENRTIIGWDIKGLTLPMLIFFLYCFLSIIVFIWLAYYSIKEERCKKIFLIVLILFSVPFLFQFERANIIFISLLGSMGFFLWKDSPNKYLRELALICLAFSAALKIYPAIFGLVLLKEKRYKETMRLIFYGIACFFLPFLFIRGGFSNIPKFIENLIYTSTIDSAQRDGYKISYSALSSFVVGKITNNTLLADQIGSKFAIFIAALGMFSFPWIKEKWKSILLLTCILIGVPSMSYVYGAIFMVIPLIYFLNAKTQGRRNIIYLLCFIAVFSPLPFGWFKYTSIDNYYIFNRSFNSLQISTAVLLLTVLLSAEGICSFYNEKVKHQICKKAILFIGILSFAFFLCIWCKGSYSTAVEEKKQAESIVTKKLNGITVNFNGRDYTGKYEGETLADKPCGKGTFTFKEKDGGIQISGKWDKKGLNEKIRITYPDQTYETVYCDNGQIYGTVIHYDSNKSETGKDWYYGTQKLSRLKQQALSCRYEDIKAVNSLNPGTVFKFQGNVTKITQFESWIEFVVKDEQGNQYLISYMNGIFNAGNSVKSPRIQKGQQLIFYGKVNENTTKKHIGIDLITAEFPEEMKSDLKVLDTSYDSIMLYPYEYIGQSLNITGIVKKIIYDTENNEMAYLVENENGKLYSYVINLEKIFAQGYNLPKEKKVELMNDVKKILPKVNEEIAVDGKYKGNYILKTQNKKEYQLLPYISSFVDTDADGKYIIH